MFFHQRLQIPCRRSDFGMHFFANLLHSNRLNNKGLNFF